MTNVTSIEIRDLEVRNVTEQTVEETEHQTFQKMCSTHSITEKNESQDCHDILVYTCMDSFDYQK